MAIDHPGRQGEGAIRYESQKRGQIASMDVALSAVVFALLVFSFISFLHAESISELGRSADDRRAYKTEVAVERLALSEGSPSNWNNLSYTVPGISCGQGTFCARKIAALNLSYFGNYTKLRSSLGLGGYDFAILVFNGSANNYSGALYNITTASGYSEMKNSSGVSRADFISVQGTSELTLVLYAWEK